MISAKYPLSDSKDFLEVYIGLPEVDPKSLNDDRRCECKIYAPNYEKIFHTYGIDKLQCLWLSLRHMRVKISNFEKETKMKCEYHYFQDFED